MPERDLIADSKVEVLIEPQVVAERAARRGPVSMMWHGAGSAAEWIFGTMALIVGLAVLATIPILQFLSLGYLLEATGRVARSGRFRHGLVGVRKAARIGGLVMGVWLWMWPLRFASSMWADARLIGNQRAAQSWHAALFILSVLVLGHIVGACLRGARLRDFLWPRPILLVKQLIRRGTYAHARDAVWDFIAALRLPYYLWLGVRGFAGAVMWLVVPVSMLAVASRLSPGAGVLVGLAGGLLMALVLLHLPYLQARFAAENRFRALFELREVRRKFAAAPIAFLFALVFTLVLALPLYLFKIEIVPRDAAWMPSLLFVMSIFPARLLTGWAYARGVRYGAKRNWFFRWTSRLAMIGVTGVYVLIVYFTQYLSWYGVWSLYEQHAFLLPVPFLGL